MVIDKLVFENAEGAETRTKKLQILADKHNRSGLQVLVHDGWVQNLTTSFKLIDVGGTTRIDKTNGDFYYDSQTKRLIINEGGIYTFAVGMALAFPSPIELEATIFVNGTDWSPLAHPTAQGRGNTKPASMVIVTTVELQKGDILEMKAKVDVATQVTCTGVQSTIEKKMFN